MFNLFRIWFPVPPKFSFQTQLMPSEAQQKLNQAANQYLSVSYSENTIRIRYQTASSGTRNFCTFYGKWSKCGPQTLLNGNFSTHTFLPFIAITCLLISTVAEISAICSIVEKGIQPLFICFIIFPPALLLLITGMIFVINSEQRVLQKKIVALINNALKD